MLSSDPFSGAISFPATQLQWCDWGWGPGDKRWQDCDGGGGWWRPLQSVLVPKEMFAEWQPKWHVRPKPMEVVSVRDKILLSSPVCSDQMYSSPSALGSFLEQCKTWGSGCWKGKSLMLDGRQPKSRARSSKKGAGETSVFCVTGMEQDISSEEGLKLWLLFSSHRSGSYILIRKEMKWATSLHEKKQHNKEPRFIYVSLFQCSIFPNTKPRLNYCTIKRVEPAVTWRLVQFTAKSIIQKAWRISNGNRNKSAEQKESAGSP